jgi:hypothetical protein
VAARKHIRTKNNQNSLKRILFDLLLVLSVKNLILPKGITLICCLFQRWINKGMSKAKNPQSHMVFTIVKSIDL